MAGNKNLNAAKQNKNDEFYTRGQDIHKEILVSGCYTGCFKNKVVLCNCNDQSKSGFARFFMKRFNFLHLRKLYIVSYGGDASVQVYDRSGIKRYPLTGDGDFRSEEGIKILQHADIVCTNPPFSLFRDFLKMLIEYDKQFLIVGNVNEMLCKDIFPMFMNGSVRYGSGVIKTFQTSESDRKFGNIGWFTNIGTPKYQGPLDLTRCYTGNESLYPAYDNYDAISVDKVKNIPSDYNGKMGVPGGYLLVHDPSQYEIIGTSGMLAGPVMLSDGTVMDHPGRFYINGKRLYDRVVIKKIML